MVGWLVENLAEAAWWQLALWVVFVPIGVAFALIVPVQEGEGD
jgi:hypothetical protein